MGRVDLAFAHLGGLAAGRRPWPAAHPWVERYRRQRFENDRELDLVGGRAPSSAPRLCARRRRERARCGVASAAAIIWLRRPGLRPGHRLGFISPLPPKSRQIFHFARFRRSAFARGAPRHGDRLRRSPLPGSAAPPGSRAGLWPSSPAGSARPSRRAARRSRAPSAMAWCYGRPGAASPSSRAAGVVTPPSPRASARRPSKRSQDPGARLVQNPPSATSTSQPRFPAPRPPRALRPTLWACRHPPPRPGPPSQHRAATAGSAAPSPASRPPALMMACRQSATACAPRRACRRAVGVGAGAPPAA